MPFNYSGHVQCSVTKPVDIEISNKGVVLTGWKGIIRYWSLIIM